MSDDDLTQEERAQNEAIQLAILDLGITIESLFVPWSLSRNSGDKFRSLNWKVTFCVKGNKIATTDFSAGEAYCPSYSHCAPDHRSVDEDNALQRECETGYAWTNLSFPMKGKAILPDIKLFLGSFIQDVKAIDFPSFESWADDLYVSPDSRKWLGVYNDCVKIGLAVRAALGEEGLARLKNVFANY
jgi:hypothetical protein